MAGVRKTLNSKRPKIHRLDNGFVDQSVLPNPELTDSEDSSVWRNVALYSINDPHTSESSTSQNEYSRKRSKS